MEVLSQRIIQIIPAKDVVARFLLKDGEKEDHRVICWALREVVTEWAGDETFTDQEVVGLTFQQESPLLIEVDSDDLQDKFIGYYYADITGE